MHVSDVEKVIEILSVFKAQYTIVEDSDLARYKSSKGEDGAGHLEKLHIAKACMLRKLKQKRCHFQGT